MTEQKTIEQKVSVIRNTTLIGELVDVTLPVPDVAEVDATSFDSPSMIEQVIAGWIKQGQAKFTLNYLPITSHDALINNVYARATDLWTFVLPTSGRGYSFSGFMKNVDEKIPLKDGHQLTVTVTPQTQKTQLTTVSAGLATTFISFTNQADEAITAFTPTPAAAATLEYFVTSFTDDTGIKIIPVFSAGTCYVNGTSVATGVASAAITIGTTVGSITNIPVVVWESAKVPKVYWVRVTHGTVASPT